MYSKIKSLTLIIFLSASIYASDNNKSKVSKDAIFSLNKKVYTTKDFPKEYQSLSKKEQDRFVSRYIYYTLLSQTLQKEAKTYQTQIKDAIQKRDNDLAKKGITLTALEKITLDKKIISDTIGYNEILKKHKKIEKEIKTFYEENKKGFNLPNRAEISHIVLKDENLSKELLSKLQKTNDIKLFAKFAKEYSLDKKTKYSGGYVGDISKESIGNETFKIIWNAKDNTVIPKILKHKDRFHIVYLFTKKKAGQRTLVEEKKNIESYLLQKEIRKWERAIILKLKKEAEVIHY